MDIAWYKKATGGSITNLYTLIPEEQIKYRGRMPQGHSSLHLIVPEECIYKEYMFLSFLTTYSYTRMPQLL